MSSEATTVILPLDLGAAAKYDQHVFPLAYHDGLGGNVNKGSLLLSATLEEMVKIKELGIDLSNSDEFLFNTRIKYESSVVIDRLTPHQFIWCSCVGSLAAKRAKLQTNRKTINPFKAFLNYRAARMFHAASLTLYLETKVSHLWTADVYPYSFLSSRRHLRRYREIRNSCKRFRVQRCVMSTVSSEYLNGAS